VLSGCVKVVTKTVEIEKIRTDTVFIRENYPINKLNKKGQKEGFWYTEQGYGYYESDEKIGVWNGYSHNGKWFEQRMYPLKPEKSKYARPITLVVNTKEESSDEDLALEYTTRWDNNIKFILPLKEETLIIDYYTDNFTIKSISYAKGIYKAGQEDALLVDEKIIYYPSGNLKAIIKYPKEGVYLGEDIGGLVPPAIIDITYFYDTSKKNLLKKGRASFNVSDYAQADNIGTWQYFSEKGKLIKEEFYDKGKLIKTKEYKP